MTRVCFAVQIFTFVLLLHDSSTQTSEPIEQEMVLIKPHTDVKHFRLPTSEEPVVSWMDIQKGIYPNTSQILTPLALGEPITIFVYLKDNSNLYDIMVTDCWAYDDINFRKAKNKLHLSEDRRQNLKRGKLIEKWSKVRFPLGHELKAMLYTDLTSFRFQDTEQIFITCGIQLCFKSCDRLLEKNRIKN